MHLFINTLEKVATKYSPSRNLSFDIVHIFKTLQLIENRGHVSRELLCEELGLGEGSIKTLIKHLKLNNLIQTDRRGTKMTKKGGTILMNLQSQVPAETALPKCSIALGKFNHAILLKQLGYAIRSGIEQRDAAIKIRGTGATTLVYRNNKFVMPLTSASDVQDTLHNEQDIRLILIEKLKPQEGDAIIIGSADTDRRTAELAAKNAVLLTLVNHDRHT
jgi:hypothetical protein